MMAATTPSAGVQERSGGIDYNAEYRRFLAACVRGVDADGLFNNRYTLACEEPSKVGLCGTPNFLIDHMAKLLTVEADASGDTFNDRRVSLLNDSIEAVAMAWWSTVGTQSVPDKYNNKVDQDLAIKKCQSNASAFLKALRGPQILGLFQDKLVPAFAADSNWTLNEVTAFVALILEPVVLDIVHAGHCKYHGIPDSFSAFLNSKTDAEIVANHEAWRQSAKDNVGVLNCMIKAYFLAGFCIFMRVQNAIEKGSSQVLPSKLHIIAKEVLLGPDCFYPQDGETTSRAAAAVGAEITASTATAQKYGGYKFATSLTFDYFVLIVYLYYDFMSPERLVLFVNEDPLPLVREKLSNSKIAFSLFKKLPWPEDITDDFLWLLHKFVVAGFCNVANKDLVSGKIKSILGAKVGASIRDKLKAICESHDKASSGTAVETSEKKSKDTRATGTDVKTGAEETVRQSAVDSGRQVVQPGAAGEEVVAMDNGSHMRQLASKAPGNKAEVQLEGSRRPLSTLQGVNFSEEVGIAGMQRGADRVAGDVENDGPPFLIFDDNDDLDLLGEFQVEDVELSDLLALYRDCSPEGTAKLSNTDSNRPTSPLTMFTLEWFEVENASFFDVEDKQEQNS
jgi:hypothetical protein